MVSGAGKSSWQVMVFVTPEPDLDEQSYKRLIQVGREIASLYGCNDQSLRVVHDESEGASNTAELIAQGIGFSNPSKIISAKPVIELLDGKYCLIVCQSADKLQSFIAQHLAAIRSDTRQLTHQGQIAFIQVKQGLVKNIHFPAYKTGSILV